MRVALLTCAAVGVGGAAVAGGLVGGAVASGLVGGLEVAAAGVPPPPGGAGAVPQEETTAAATPRNSHLRRAQGRGPSRLDSDVRACRATRRALAAQPVSRAPGKRELLVISAAPRSAQVHRAVPPIGVGPPGLPEV